jgi:hypothetical protein
VGQVLVALLGGLLECTLHVGEILVALTLTGLGMGARLIALALELLAGGGGDVALLRDGVMQLGDLGLVGITQLG